MKNKDIAAILSQTDHRPWPLPQASWIMEQGWYGLLFAHWRVPVSQVRILVPKELELDTFHGEAWASMTPLQIRMRPRGLFSVGRVWSFPELNFRTYVQYQGIAGIYFFSLDAGSSLAIAGARAFYRLPYFKSKMEMSRTGPDISFKSDRRSSPAFFYADYRPVSPAHLASAGTLEHWLTERYCLYVTEGKQVWRGEIHHPPWLLQNVTAEISRNTVDVAAGLPLSGPPALTEYAEQQEVLVWPLRKT